MRIVCISDTHGLHEGAVVPPCDVLVHAGDITMTGELDMTLSLFDWFARQPAKHVVFIAGNHDFNFEARDPRYDITIGPARRFHYLQDSAVILDGVKFYGSPWVPNLIRWAFYGRRDVLAAAFSLIPSDTEVLITHGPARGVRDTVRSGERVGSEELRNAVRDLPCLDLHVFGHIHEDYGHQDNGRGLLSVNASLCDVGYNPVNPPIVVDLVDGKATVCASV